MELRQLRYLVALADEESFTRAAEREHIAQPALSQQIQKLEQELGLPLVERTTRRVSITDAGNLLVARARRVLTELESARQELDRVRGIQTGHVARRRDEHDGPGRHHAGDRGLPRAASAGRADGARGQQRRARGDAARRRARPRVPVGDRAGREPRPGASADPDGGAGRRAAREPPARRPRGDQDGRARSARSSSATARARGCASCWSAPPTRLGSRRGSSSSPTRAGASGGWSGAASASRSCRARTRSASAPTTRSPWRGWSIHRSRATSRSPGARGAGCPRRWRSS